VWAAPTRTLGIGARFEHIRTAYRTTSSTEGPLDLEDGTGVATFSTRGQQRLPGGLSLAVGASWIRSGGRSYGAPRADLLWQRWSPLTVTLSAGRAFQFAQSLRNAESVVGRIFPPDLFVGSGHPEVPVARSDEITIGVDVRPHGSLHLRAQTYRRALANLILVAPRAGAPSWRPPRSKARAP